MFLFGMNFVESEIYFHKISVSHSLQSMSSWSILLWKQECLWILVRMEVEIKVRMEAENKMELNDNEFFPYFDPAFIGFKLPFFAL